MMRELPGPVLLVILITSAQATFPFTYQSLQLPVPITPHFLYGSIQENPTLRGYSYTTQDFDGGSSGVVFVSGPESEVKMKEELDIMKEMAPAGSQKLSEDSKSSSMVVRVGSTSPKPEEIGATTEPDTKAVEKLENKDDETSDEKMKENKIPQDPFFLSNPYSLFRFQSQLQPYPLNFQRFYGPPTASGYLQPQGIFQDQFFPYNQYNAFQKNFYPSSPDYYYPSLPGLVNLQEFTGPAVNSIEEGKPAAMKQPLVQAQTSLPEQQSSTTEVSSTSEAMKAIEDTEATSKEPQPKAAASADAITESTPVTSMETTTAQAETEASTVSVDGPDSETPSSPTEKP